MRTRAPSVIPIQHCCLLLRYQNDLNWWKYNFKHWSKMTLSAFCISCSKIINNSKSPKFWFCTANCTVVALSSLSKTGFASAWVAWGFFHERGYPSYQNYKLILILMYATACSHNKNPKLCHAVVRISYPNGIQYIYIYIYMLDTVWVTDSGYCM